MTKICPYCISHLEALDGSLHCSEAVWERRSGGGCDQQRVSPVLLSLPPAWLSLSIRKTLHLSFCSSSLLTSSSPRPLPPLSKASRSLSCRVDSSQLVRAVTDPGEQWHLSMALAPSTILTVLKTFTDWLTALITNSFGRIKNLSYLFIFRRRMWWGWDLLSTCRGSARHFNVTVYFIKQQSCQCWAVRTQQPTSQRVCSETYYNIKAHTHTKVPEWAWYCHISISTGFLNF